MRPWRIFLQKTQGSGSLGISIIFIDTKMPTLIDTHAHYYTFCSFSDYLETSFTNANLASGQDNEDALLVLCLMETATSDWYEQLLINAQKKLPLGNWKLTAEDEGNHLRAIDHQRRTVLIIPSHQIISSEKLEVLIIGVRNRIQHGQNAQTYIEKFSDDKLVILPWGVGKWLGRRGRLIGHLINLWSPHRFVLGDNRGRPLLWSNVPAFKKARQLGIPVIAGSDPLPLSGQQKFSAAYGILTDEVPPQKNLAEYLRDLLLKRSMGFTRDYGTRDNLTNFFCSQVMLRFRSLPKHGNLSSDWQS